MSNKACYSFDDWSNFLYTTQNSIYGCITAGSWSSKFSVVTLLWKCSIMCQWKWHKSRSKASQGFV